MMPFWWKWFTGSSANTTSPLVHSEPRAFPWSRAVVSCELCVCLPLFIMSLIVTVLTMSAVGRTSCAYLMLCVFC